MIKGTNIYLIEKIKKGVDPLGGAIFEERKTLIKDVLVGLPSTDDITESFNIDGKRISYVLGIPKGDNHEWENREVIIFGKRYKTFGFLIEGIEENLPLRWHKQIKVERFK